MARRTLPRIFERPIYFVDDADLRATLSERWRQLCEAEGVRLTRPVFDVRSETLLDAIAREPKAARDLLAALAARSIACFRTPAQQRRAPGAKKRTGSHYEIAERFIALEGAHPDKSEAQLCGMLLRAMKKDCPAVLASAAIKTSEGIRSAVRNAVRRHAEFLDLYARSKALAERTRRTEAAALTIHVTPGALGIVGLVPKAPIDKRIRRKKVRRESAPD